MENLAIYNQGVVKLLCDPLDIEIKEGSLYLAYINPKTNKCRISSGNHFYYNDYIKQEIIKVLNKVLNREI